MEERRYARGEYEELKDRRSEISTPLRALRDSLSSKFAVSSNMIDIDEAISTLKQIDIIQKELETIEPKIQELKSKWGFK